MQYCRTSNDYRFRESSTTAKDFRIYGLSVDIEYDDDHRVGGRYYVRFDDEWDEPQSEDGNPRWFTAVYVGLSPKSVARGRPEGYWDIDGVSRWRYGTDELVIGDRVDGALWPARPATRDRAVVIPGSDQ